MHANAHLPAFCLAKLKTLQPRESACESLQTCIYLFLVWNNEQTGHTLRSHPDKYRGSHPAKRLPFVRVV